MSFFLNYNPVGVTIFSTEHNKPRNVCNFKTSLPENMHVLGDDSTSDGEIAGTREFILD
jgi:hypothetical protein